MPAESQSRNRSDGREVGLLDFHVLDHSDDEGVTIIKKANFHSYQGNAATPRNAGDESGKLYGEVYLQQAMQANWKHGGQGLVEPMRVQDAGCRIQNRRKECVKQDQW